MLRYFGTYYYDGVKTVIEGKWFFGGKQVVADESCKQIDSMITASTFVASRDGGWARLYRAADGQFWELTYPQGEMHGGGPPRLESFSSDEVRANYPGVILA